MLLRGQLVVTVTEEAEVVAVVIIEGEMTAATDIAIIVDPYHHHHHPVERMILTLMLQSTSESLTTPVLESLTARPHENRIMPISQRRRRRT